MECFWMTGKQCPYLDMVESKVSVSDSTAIYPGPPFIMKKEQPMLQNFTVAETCENCLAALHIRLKGRI